MTVGRLTIQSSKCLVVIEVDRVVIIETLRRLFSCVDVIDIGNLYVYVYEKNNIWLERK